MRQVINQNASRKGSTVVSAAQIRLAEVAITNGTIVETILDVIDTATFVAKQGMDDCSHHLQSAQSIDEEWVLEMLIAAWDRVQLVLVLNALTEMSGISWWIRPSGLCIQGSGICVCRWRGLFLARISGRWSICSRPSFSQLSVWCSRMCW